MTATIRRLLRDPVSVGERAALLRILREAGARLPLADLVELIATEERAETRKAALAHLAAGLIWLPREHERQRAIERLRQVAGADDGGQPARQVLAIAALDLLQPRRRDRR